MIPVKNNIFWVGKTDWELRRFHGDEYSTHRGSTYNSYLIKEEKTVLIDTVWKPFAKEYVDRLSAEINLDEIDFIVINHGEIDHSGALPELMEHIPDTPIYCSENAVQSLKGHYHQDWDFRTVKTGDRLEVGNGKELVFVEMKMLHWPDSLACYLTGEEVLFSNDAFGQHYATERLFNDLVDQCELYQEAIKYYANILNPFSPLVEKKIREILALELPIDIIATSHGVIWRDNPTQIVEKYLEWAGNYQENQITLLYDTMWEGTRILAENIARGIKKGDPEVEIKLFNTAKTDKNDILTEVFKSKTVLFGSPTINRTILMSMAAILDGIEGLKFKEKKAAAFGCYGWSGEGVGKLNEMAMKAGFELIEKGLKVKWMPDAEVIEEAVDFGKRVGEKSK